MLRKFRPSVEQLENRLTPSLSSIKSFYHIQPNLGANQKVAIISTGHNSFLQKDLNLFCRNNGIPTTKIAYHWPFGKPHEASPEEAGETAMGVQWIHGLSPKAQIISVEISRHQEFAILGVAAAAGRIADVVVMPFTFPVELHDIGLFRTNWPVPRYAHPDTIFVSAAGNGGNVRSPANYRSVLAVGATNIVNGRESVWNESVRGKSVLSGKYVPDVVAVGGPKSSESFYLYGQKFLQYGTSLASYTWAAVAANVQGRFHEDWSTQEFISFLKKHPRFLNKVINGGLGSPNFKL